MDPLTIIVSAVAAGAAAASKDVVAEAMKDAYTGLKTLIQRKYQDKEEVQDALDGVEKKPESEPRQGVLKEELETVKAGEDTELVKEAQKLLDLLKEHGVEAGITYHLDVSGSGAGAQDHSVAAGAGGMAFGGDAQGDVMLGRPGKKSKKKK